MNGTYIWDNGDAFGDEVFPKLDWGRANASGEKRYRTVDAKGFLDAGIDEGHAF